MPGLSRPPAQTPPQERASAHSLCRPRPGHSSRPPSHHLDTPAVRRHPAPEAGRGPGTVTPGGWALGRLRPGVQGLALVPQGRQGPSDPRPRGSGCMGSTTPAGAPAPPSEHGPLCPRGPWENQPAAWGSCAWKPRVASLSVSLEVTLLPGPHQDHNQDPEMSKQNPPSFPFGVKSRSHMVPWLPGSEPCRMGRGGSLGAVQAPHVY